jgi:hypothetical protein
MRSLVAVFLVATTLLAQVSAAGQHVVASADLEGRLAEAARVRAGDLATIDAVLSLPEVARAGERHGVPIGTLRQCAAALSDAELHQLAVRARALRLDPVAGSPIVPVIPGWVIVLFLVVIVALLVGLAYGVDALVS